MIRHNGIIYAGTDKGVYSSHDTGSPNWVSASSGLPSGENWIMAMAVDPDGYLYCNSIEGVFRTVTPVQ